MNSTSTFSANSETYALLLHALTHEDTNQNIERHQLLLQKWCRDFANGFYIRDLTSVVACFRVLRERFFSYPEMFRDIITSVLVICSNPLIEAKANDRLRLNYIENINTYLMEITYFASIDDVVIKTQVAKCFRFIANGCEDPTILRADRKERVGSDYTQPVTDKLYLQNLIRESRAIEAIVNEFNASVDRVKIENNLFQNAPTSEVESRRVTLGLAQELTETLLNLCLELSVDIKLSIDMCGLRLCNGLIRLFDHISIDNPRDPRVSDLINLVWTLMESYLNQPVTAENTQDTIMNHPILDFEFAIHSLKRVLLIMLHDGYRLADKELRNEIIAVLNMIALFPSAMPCFMSSGLFNILITYSCVAEAGADNWPFYTLPIAKLRNFASVIDVDLQFKRNLWLLLSDILKMDDPDCMLCMASSPMLEVLLQYCEYDSHDHSAKMVAIDAKYGMQSPKRESSQVIGGNSIMSGIQTSVDSSLLDSNTMIPVNNGVEEAKSQSIVAGDDSASNSTTKTSKKASGYLSSLSLNQLRELQVVAMIFLAGNAPKVISEFLRINGPSRVLDVIFNYAKSSVCEEHTNLVYHCTLLLNRCIMGSNMVRQLMEHENAVQTLLYLLEGSTHDPTKTQISRIIAILCSNNNVVCQGQVHAHNGIGMLVKLVAQYAEFAKPLVGKKAGVPESHQLIGGNPAGGEGEIEDPNEDPRNCDVPVLIVAIIDCFSKSIVKNYNNEALFASEEGMDALLELLEVSPYVVRTPILRLLCDLLENNILLPFLNAWRSGKTMRSAAQIITHCWLDEEARLDARRPLGILGNVLDSLGNHNWPDDKINQTMGESVSSNMETVRSYAVSKLANALIASKALLGANDMLGLIPMDIRASVLEKDSRVIIANILSLIGLYDEPLNGSNDVNEVTSPVQPQSPDNNGIIDDDGNDIADVDNDFELMSHDDENDHSVRSTKPLPVLENTKDLGLSPRDRQVIVLAKRYYLLREGEWWRSVSDDLVNNGITPIEADSIMIDAYICRAFDAVQSVQLEQMSLLADDNSNKVHAEGEFINGILTKKQQQIKAVWLKRKGKAKSIVTPF